MVDETQDLLYAQMLVQYGLTPEQVDKLPIKTLILLPIVRLALEGPQEGAER